MRNYKRIFSPTASFSSYGDLSAVKFLGGFIMIVTVGIVLWLMWINTKTVQDYPKVLCREEICAFYFEDGTERTLPRSSVPFDKNGLVIKEQIVWP